MAAPVTSWIRLVGAAVFFSSLWADPLSAKVLLKDSFASFSGGMTRPEIAPTNYPGGVLAQGVTEASAGKKGVVLNGISRVVYPLGGLVNLSAGGFSIRAFLNFDPAELDHKAKPGLRNHFFFTIFGPGKSHLCCYTIHYKELRLIGYDEAGREKFSKALPLEWEPFDPHKFGIRWGEKLELFCDGRSITAPWQGLFNATTGDANTLRAVIGSWETATAGESCFTVENVQLDDGSAPQTSASDDAPVPYQSQFILEGYPPLPVTPAALSPADVRRSFRMTEFRSGDGLTPEDAERRMLERTFR